MLVVLVWCHLCSACEPFISSSVPMGCLLSVCVGMVSGAILLNVEQQLHIYKPASKDLVANLYKVK